MKATRVGSPAGIGSQALSDADFTGSVLLMIQRLPRPTGLLDLLLSPLHSRQEEEAQGSGDSKPVISGAVRAAAALSAPA